MIPPPMPNEPVLFDTYLTSEAAHEYRRAIEAERRHPSSSNRLAEKRARRRFRNEVHSAYGI